MKKHIQRTSTIVMNSSINPLSIGFLFLLLFTMLTQPSVSYAQDIDEMRTTIRLAARSIEGPQVQIRFYPDRRELMRSSLADGFILDRRTGNGNFTEIARIKAFDEAGWRSLHLSAGQSERAKDIGLAYLFLQTMQTMTSAPLSFDEGIQALEEQKSQEEIAYFAFIVSSLKSADIAQALGLSYTDAQVQTGQSYTYRVRPVQEPIDYSFEATEISLTVGSNAPQEKIEIEVYEGDGFLSFNWAESSWLTGALIERMAPGESSYRSLMDQPLFSLQSEDPDQGPRSSFADSNLVNYRPYSYRFSGFTLFGEKVTFAEIKAMPRDRTPPEAPFMPVPEHINPREVRVQWNMNEPPAQDLLGFVVARSTTNEGSFRVLHNGFLPRETRSFVDTTFSLREPNYYIVQAIDTSLNVSSSFPMAVSLVDSIPPAKPVFMSAKVDSLGIVKLELALNPEEDLMGYRLFKSNDPEHEFSVFTEAFSFVDSLRSPIQTVFTDTISLNSLTEKIYYRAQALDLNYNSSEISELIALARPDTIPPSVPVFFNVIAHPDQIELHYFSSESYDLVRQELYRRTNESEIWTLIDTLSTQSTLYVDKAVEQGRDYIYSMRAFDRSNLASEYAFAVYGRAYDDGKRPAVDNIRSSQNEQTIQLQWDYEIKNSEVYFVIYRQNEEGLMEQHARVEQTNFSERVKPGRSYIYAIRAYTSDGGQSALSQEITINVD